MTWGYLFDLPHPSLSTLWWPSEHDLQTQEHPGRDASPKGKPVRTPAWHNGMQWVWTPHGVGSPSLSDISSNRTRDAVTANWERNSTGWKLISPKTSAQIQEQGAAGAGRGASGSQPPVSDGGPLGLLCDGNQLGSGMFNLTLSVEGEESVKALVCQRTEENLDWSEFTEHKCLERIAEGKVWKLAHTTKAAAESSRYETRNPWISVTAVGLERTTGTN